MVARVWQKDELVVLLQVCSFALNSLRQETGKIALVSYGISLGRLRQGTFIPHDGDLDVFTKVAVSESELDAVVAQTRRHIQQRGLDVSIKKVFLDDASKSGFLKLRLSIGNGPGLFDIDFFSFARDQGFDAWGEWVSWYDWVIGSLPNPLPEENTVIDHYFDNYFNWCEPTSQASFLVSSLDSYFVHLQYSMNDFLIPTPNPYVDQSLPVELKAPLVVGTSGCFDPLHAGHIDFLLRASCLSPNCNFLVFLPSDQMMMEYKGKCSVPASERVQHVLAIKGVSQVIIIDNWKEIASFRVDIMIEAEEYQNRMEEFYQTRGEMRFLPRSAVPVSSTQLNQTGWR